MRTEVLTGVVLKIQVFLDVHHVDWDVVINVSNYCSVLIFRVKQSWHNNLQNQ